MKLTKRQRLKQKIYERIGREHQSRIGTHPRYWKRPAWETKMLRGCDPGIRQFVLILSANGIETFESCQGGYGHAFPEPTIRFHGGAAAMWRAMALCLTYGLPVLNIRRTWDVLEGEPTGPYNEIVFKRQATARQRT